jgi:predicted kinase
VTSPPTLLLLTGPPGTGKSTLADAAAHALGSAVLGWDWAMAALTPFEPVSAALRGMTVDEYRSVGWSLLCNLATAQLRRRASVVLDGVARDPEVRRARDLAAAAGARCLVVATACADAGLHRSRVEGRRRDIPGWHELTWDHVAGVVARWTPPADADLHLDATEPLDANVRTLLALLDAPSRTDTLRG